MYNYNTMERVHDFEAHSDYLRSIAVHPTLPYIITSSDDMTIKLWDWEKRWENVQVKQALFLSALFFVQIGNCSPFLKLTPTLRQMPPDVTNISED